jgi:hypothetical protein
MTRARMSFMGVLLRLDPVTYTTPGLGQRIKRALSRSRIGQRIDGHLPQLDLLMDGLRYRASRAGD